MTLRARAMARLRYLLGRDRAEREMDEEMRFHLERELEEEIAGGADPAEARRRALVRFGGVERFKEEARDARGVRGLTDLAGDLRYALRVLRRNPAFAAASVATLALGVGAATSIFSIVHSVLLRPLPYAAPDGIAVLWERNVARGREQNVVSPANFEAWRERAAAFADIAAMVPAPLTFAGPSGTERLPGVEVSPSYFRILGVAPHRGRLLVDDDATLARDVVMIGHDFWQQRYGGEPVVGRTITLGARARTIVGVLPPGFDPPRFSWLGEQHLWLPFSVTPENRTWGRFLLVLGRLRPGVTLDRAREEMVALAGALEVEQPSNAGWSATVVGLGEQIVGPVRTQLRTLLAAVALLLIMSVVNVANLMLAHTRARAQELAVRTALGGSRRRIIRQLATQGAMIAAAGGLGGIALAIWGTRGLATLLPATMPRVDAIRVDATVLLASAGIAVAAALVIGVLPALRGAAGGAIVARTQAGPRTTGRLDGGGLLIAELALATVLCATAGLLVRSFVALRTADLGFQAGGVAVARVALPEGRYGDAASVAAFHGQLLQRLRGRDDVQGASSISLRPLGGMGVATSAFPEGRPQPPAGEAPVTDVRIADSAYFEVMGVPLRAGRTFGSVDRSGAPVVMIVNETMARTFWGTESPLGRRATVNLYSGLLAEVVGVVGDVQLDGARAPVRPTVYLSSGQIPGPTMDVLVRAPGDAAAVAGVIRATVASIDPQVPVYQATSLDALVTAGSAGERFNGLVVAAFALSSLLLAAVGVYGVMAGDVARRRREIGIRLALGATPVGVLGMVMRRAMGRSALGVLVGVAGAVIAARSMAALLYGVSATDPAALVAVAALLLATTVAGVLIPARRAAGVAPTVAMRDE